MSSSSLSEKSSSESVSYSSEGGRASATATSTRKSSTSGATRTSNFPALSVVMLLCRSLDCKGLAMGGPGVPVTPPL